MAHSQPEGFLAVPSIGKGPGVLVLHAWWRLNDTMKAFCTRLVESGFVAFAPDLYHGKAILNDQFDTRLVLEPFAQLRLLSRILSIQSENKTA